jgi:hypothetical protein
MRTFILMLLLVSVSAKGVNIMVIDGGLEPGYRNTLANQNRILRESCYSNSMQLRQPKPASSLDPKYRLYYDYLIASLCQDTQEVQHGIGASVLRTWQPQNPSHLLGAEGRSGIPDDGVPVDIGDHQTIIAGVIAANTPQSVRQWHAHNESLVGFDGLGEPSFQRYTNLNQGGRATFTVDALKDAAEGSLFGVKVISISEFVGSPLGTSDISDRYTTPCDNHPDVTDPGLLNNYAKYIKMLRDRGVIFVVATDNSVVYPSNNGDLTRDNDKIPFPACLSTTIAVGGLSSLEAAQGALGPGVDFVENYHAQHPVTTGANIGVSFAAPRIASYLADIRTVAPGINSVQALNALRNTGSLHCGSRQYGNITKQYCITKANVNAAKNSVVDSILSDFIALINDYEDETKYGWNYGTSRHENGVLSYFETIEVPQNKQLQPTFQKNGLTTIIHQSSTIGQPTLKFMLRPFDIDTVNEVEVLVNGTSYGFLKTTGSNQLGSTQSVCIANEDLKSDGTDNEVVLKQKNSDETWGITNLKVEVGTVDSACLKAPPTFPNLPSNGDRVAGTSEPSGNAYQRAKVNQVPFSFNLRSANNGLPTSTTYNGKTIQRDLRVKFTIKSGAVSNATTLKVNGADVLTTPSITGDTERSYEFIVNRNRLIGGSNTFEFRPSNTGANSVWGIRGVSIEYIDPVTLAIDSNNATRYGYNQAPNRYTGLRANFTLGTVENDYVFTAQGWGIDRADETQVFINGVPLGFLNAGSSSGLSSIQSFVVTRAFLLPGANQIEFAQRRPGPGWSGASFEQWGVEGMKVSVLKPDLIPLNTRIIEPEIQENVPFSLKAVISNIGVGSSSATTLHYYTSTDSVINSADTFMESRAVGALSPGTSATIVNVVQSPLVNQGYYIGVCLVAVPNEVTASNNCSKGIQMRSNTTIVPIIMLLLNDE